MLESMKLEISGVFKDYISRLHILLDEVIFNGTAKTKLAMLAFLLCEKLFSVDSLEFN